MRSRNRPYVELHINRNTDFNGIVTVLPACQHLKRLKLADNNVLSPGFLQKLGQLAELTELDLPEFGIDNGQEPILGLSQCKHLTHLRLAGYHLKPGDVEEILKLKNLKLFDHSDTWNGAVGLRGLFRMKSLEEFVAYSPQYCRPGLTDERFRRPRRIVQPQGTATLGQCHHRQRARPNCRPASARAAQARAHVHHRPRPGHAETDSGLAELDLFDTEISDDGLKELAGFRGLTDFDLGVTEITDAGLAHLRRLRAPGTIESRRHLDHGCRAVPSGRSQVARRTRPLGNGDHGMWPDAALAFEELAVALPQTNGGH